MLENLVYVELKRRGLEIYYHADKVECGFIVREGIHITAAYQVTRSLANEDTKERETNGSTQCFKSLQPVRRDHPAPKKKRTHGI